MYIICSKAKCTSSSDKSAFTSISSMEWPTWELWLRWHNVHENLHDWFTALSLCSCNGPISMMASPCYVTIIRLSICFSRWTVSFSRSGAISPSPVNFLSPPRAKGVVGAHVHIYSSYRWFIVVAPIVLLRFLAFPVRSGLCRNPVQKAIWCAS